MDPLTQNPQPQMETPIATPEAPVTPIVPTKKTSYGPMIGASIVILLLIAGALYYWSPLLIPETAPAAEVTQTQSDNDLQMAAASASVSTLESDLEGDLQGLDQSF